MMVEIRKEQPGDLEGVYAVHAAAFEQPDEADLVDALRKRAASYIGLVAVRDGDIVGHIAFTPVRMDEVPALNAWGLAPMAVLPACQRSGIGSQLVHRGLAACREAGAELVVVLGHPGYYPRFGFQRADLCGLRSVYDAPEAFMVRELADGALDAAHGLVRYDPVFGG